MSTFNVRFQRSTEFECLSLPSFLLGFYSTQEDLRVSVLSSRVFAFGIYLGIGILDLEMIEVSACFCRFWLRGRRCFQKASCLDALSSRVPSGVNHHHHHHHYHHQELTPVSSPPLSASPSSPSLAHATRRSSCYFSRHPSTPAIYFYFYLFFFFFFLSSSLT